MTIFSNLKLLNIVSKEFKLDIDGLHGIKHWESVYKNTKILASYYNLNSDVFELLLFYMIVKEKMKLKIFYMAKEQLYL